MRKRKTISNPEMDHLVNHFAGIGLKRAKTKIRNLKLDTELKIIQIFIELETICILEKTDQYLSQSGLLLKKHCFIEELIEIYTNNGLTFGIRKNKQADPTHIIYFVFEGLHFAWYFDAGNSSFKLPFFKGKANTTQKNLEKIEAVFHDKYIKST